MTRATRDDWNGTYYPPGFGIRNWNNFADAYADTTGNRRMWRNPMGGYTVGTYADIEDAIETGYTILEDLVELA